MSNPLWKFGTGTSLGAVTGIVGYMTQGGLATALAALGVAALVSIVSGAAHVIRALRIAPRGVPGERLSRSLFGRPDSRVIRVRNEYQPRRVARMSKPRALEGSNEFRQY